MRRFAILALVALFAVFLVVRRSWLREPPQDAGTLMASLAAQARQRADSEFRTSLDYTPDSVEHVEKILDKLHQAFASGELSGEQVETEAMAWGAYVGEVIRRLKGGHWSRDHEVGGPNSFPLRWETHDSFPCGWCFKRIHDGELDSIWYKFQILVLRRDEGGFTVYPAAEPPSSPVRNSSRPRQIQPETR